MAWGKVTAVQEFDGMGKGAILAVLVDAQKPYHGGEQDNRSLDKELALLLHIGKVRGIAASSTPKNPT